MLSNLFNSVFSSATSSVNPIMLGMSLLTSLLLGLALAWVYRYRTLYTKEFVIVLTVLPSILGIVIFLVNGSLGTSVAVAGTFSLVRFRSAAGGSRELLSLFISMAIGLATGMGYLMLAIVSTAVFLGIWLVLEKMTFFSAGQTVRYLTIDLPKDRNDEKRIRIILREFCNKVDLISVKSSQSGDKLELRYEIDLKSDDSDIDLTNELLNSSLVQDISMNKNVKKKKSL